MNKSQRRKEKSKLIAIEKWIQRRFMCSFTKDEIEKMQLEIKKGELLEELNVHN